jgi:hypothetical protein
MAWRKTLWLPVLVAAVHCGSAGSGSSADAGGTPGSGSDGAAPVDSSGGGSYDASSPTEGAASDAMTGSEGPASDDAAASDDRSTPGDDGSSSTDSAAQDSRSNPGQGDGGSPVGHDGGTGGRRDASSGSDAGSCGALPSGGLYGTFAVGSQIFHLWINAQPGIDQALADWHSGTTQIPNGKLVCNAPAAWNCPWHWQMDPSSIMFADVAIELCDGAPSYIEANCATFGKQYCPWSAKMIEMRDCRTDPACPAVPK